jgi:ferrochelatase
VTERQGALLINLGTPDSPAVGDVRRYLREFLSDPRVLTMGALARWLLLNAVILPFRPRRTAQAYAQVWSEDGSPLLAHGLALREAVAAELGESWKVALGMRYGRPSIATAVEELRSAGVNRVVVLPLFPQYSEAATGSALAKAEQELAAAGLDVPVSVIRSFPAHPGFIEAFSEPARELMDRVEPDWVLLSYHGLPESQIRAADADCLATSDCCAQAGRAQLDCYRAQCFATSRELAAALELDPDRHSTSFQSRLGREPWIQPFTDEVLPDLATRGVRRLLVICPSFAADCLETLEEIGIRARSQWSELGGEDLICVPCPNAAPIWVRAVSELISSR